MPVPARALKGRGLGMGSAAQRELATVIDLSLPRVEPLIASCHGEIVWLQRALRRNMMALDPLNTSPASNNEFCEVAGPVCRKPTQG